MAWTADRDALAVTLTICFGSLLWRLLRLAVWASANSLHVHLVAGSVADETRERRENYKAQQLLPPPLSNILTSTFFFPLLFQVREAVCLVNDSSVLSGASWQPMNVYLP